MNKITAKKVTLTVTRKVTYLDGLGGFAGVLEVDAKVGALGLATLGSIFRIYGIFSHDPVSSEKGETLKTFE